MSDNSRHTGIYEHAAHAYDASAASYKPLDACSILAAISRISDYVAALHASISQLDTLLYAAYRTSLPTQHSKNHSPTYRQLGGTHACYSALATNVP